MEWTATTEERATIMEIAQRAKRDFSANLMTVSMDVEATHCNGNKLKLEEFLGADSFNFAHDIYGINNNLNRKTGKLKNCFLPRYSA